MFYNECRVAFPVWTWTCTHPKGLKISSDEADHYMKKFKAFVSKRVKRYSQTITLDNLPDRGKSKKSFGAQNKQIVQLFTKNHLLSFGSGQHNWMIEEKRFNYLTCHHQKAFSCKWREISMHWRNLSFLKRILKKGSIGRAETKTVVQDDFSVKVSFRVTGYSTRGWTTLTIDWWYEPNSNERLNWLQFIVSYLDFHSILPVKLFSYIVYDK